MIDLHSELQQELFNWLMDEVIRGNRRKAEKICIVKDRLRNRKQKYLR